MDTSLFSAVIFSNVKDIGNCSFLDFTKLLLTLGNRKEHVLSSYFKQEGVSYNVTDKGRAVFLFLLTGKFQEGQNIPFHSGRMVCFLWERSQPTCPHAYKRHCDGVLDNIKPKEWGNVFKQKTVPTCLQSSKWQSKLYHLNS